MTGTMRRGYHNAITVTPSDATILSMTEALWVGGAGNVVVETMRGSVVTFTAVAAGTELRIRAVRVLAATTATLILALY